MFSKIQLLSLVTIALVATPTVAVEISEVVSFSPDASDLDGAGLFGFSAAIANSTVLVGSPSGSNGLAERLPGAAYLYDALTGSQLAKLSPSDGMSEDWFGYSVAIDERVGLVGAPLHDASGDAAGASYLYDVDSRSELGKLVASDGQAGNGFGVSVAIDRSLAIIGAPGAPSVTSDEPFTNAGAVYVFDVNTRQQLRKLTIDNDERVIGFGAAVAADEGLAVIGARESERDDSGTGSAYLFDTSTGERLVEYSPIGAHPEERFGGSVALDARNGFALVGAFPNFGEDVFSGAAYLFDLLTGKQIARLTGQFPFNWHGISVGLDNGIAYVGDTLAPTASGCCGPRPGGTYVYDAMTGSELALVSPPSPELGNVFARTMAVDEGLVVSTDSLYARVGPSHRGRAFVYKITVPEPNAMLLAALSATAGWCFPSRFRACS